MVLYESPEEVLVSSHASAAGAAWPPYCPGTGLRGRSVYLHDLLIR